MKGTKRISGTGWSNFYNFFIILCAIIALGFAGCGDDTDIITETETSGITGAISPVGIPANIRIMQNNVLVALTDADQNGNYIFSDLAEGRYELVIKSNGYEDYSRLVEVRKGQLTDLGTVTMKEVKEPPVATITITGRVVDSSTKEPIGDAIVFVECKENDTSVFSSTKKDGSFAITVRSDNIYNIGITKPGYKPYVTSTADTKTFEVNLAKEQPDPVTPRDTPVALNIGDIAPDFTLPKLEGGEMSLQDNRGKVVLIDFWATWCGPCRLTTPCLQRLYDKYKTRGLVVLGVNIAERGGANGVKKFRDEYGLTYDILLGTNTGVDTLYGIDAIPFLWLLDRNGVITWTRIGFAPEIEAEIENQILAVL